MYPSLRYIQDTFKIQCILSFLTLRYTTHKIQSRYMSDAYGIHRDTHQDTYLEPYLLGYPKPPRYVSRMYPACIPHVPRMYLDYL